MKEKQIQIRTNSFLFLYHERIHATAEIVGSSL